MISLALARLARTFRGLFTGSAARSTAAATNAEIAATAEQAARGLAELGAVEQARVVGEIETLTYNATKEALKINRGTKIVVEEAMAAAEAAGAATDLIAARAAAYAAAERLAAQSATQAATAFQKAYEAALALFEHGNVVRGLHGAPPQTEALMNAVIEATTNAAQAAKNYAYFAEQAALKAENLVVLAQGERVTTQTAANAVGAAGAVAIALTPTDVKAAGAEVQTTQAELAKENIAGNDDLSASTYEQVSLDGTGIAGLIELGIIVAPYIKEAALAITPGTIEAEEVIAEENLEQSLVKARKTYEAEDNIAIERALGSRQSPSYIIPDQNLKSPQKTDAIWAAAAGKPLTKAGTFTPVDKYSSKNLKEIVSPF